MSLFGASKRWHPMKKASCICIRIPDQLQIGTFNKNNWRKLEASELDVSVQSAYVGNRIISHLATGWSAGIYNTCKAIVMDIDPIGLSMPMFTVKADRWEVLLIVYILRRIVKLMGSRIQSVPRFPDESYAMYYSSKVHFWIVWPCTHFFTLPFIYHMSLMHKSRTMLQRTGTEWKRVWSSKNKKAK